MKKLLIIALLMLALVITAVACQPTTDEPDTSADDVTTAETPTEAPTDEPSTPAPETEPETPAPETPAPETDPETPAPETEPETPAPETEPPVDPADPVWIMDADALAAMENTVTSTVEKTEDGFASFTATGADPWFLLTGNIGEMPKYMAIRYRTNTDKNGEFFISNGANPEGGKSFVFSYNADSEWNLLIFDLSVVAPYMTEATVGHIRYDFFVDIPAEGTFLEVAYIAFFNTPEYALAYDFEMNKAPMWNENQDVIKHQNFDQFYYGNGDQDDAVKNDLNLYHAVNKPEWDFVADMVGTEHTYVTYWGWVVLMSEPVGQFGYQVGMGAPVFDDAWTVVAEQGVLDAAASQGGATGTRMRIHINTADFDGETKVRVLYKDAEGNTVCLNEVTVIAPVKLKDITDSFTADVNANEVGTTMDATDLGNFFVTELPLPGSGVEANGEGKLYHLTSINDMYADVNGKYFFKANVINSDGAGWMFARGYKVVNSDAIIEAFDPTAGFYKINNYYETDSAGAMGGAGIYARLGGGKLFIMVKYYNPETITRVGNKIYAIDAAGTELTLADNGTTVSVLVDGVTYATVELSGSKVYEDINEVDPAGEFAATAVITLKDGTTETIENTLIAATCESQIGIVARAGSFKFDALTVGGYSAIEVPALEIVTPEEPEPVDPDVPVLVLDPEYINELAGSTEQTVAQHIGSHEIITEDGVTFVRLTSNGGDPYVALVKLGSYLELPPYMAFAYRTNCDLDAHVFIGSGSGWNGNGDVASVAWNQDNNWNLAVLDLNNAGLTSIQGGIISYCRFDFFTGNGVGNMDIEYVAFFNSAEAAQKYFNKLHGGADEEPETPVVPEEPAVENYLVPQDQWTVSGHCAQIVGKEGHANSPMVAAGGIDSGALLHQGAVGIGEIDLSKYSKVIVKYGIDGSQVTIDKHAANGTNRIMLSKADNHMTNAPANENVIASVDYTPSGWALTAIEIDLTAVDYNGPVFLTWDTLAGTFMLIGSIEFVA